MFCYSGNCSVSLPIYLFCLLLPSQEGRGYQEKPSDRHSSHTRGGWEEEESPKKRGRVGGLNPRSPISHSYVGGGGFWVGLGRPFTLNLRHCKSPLMSIMFFIFIFQDCGCSASESQEWWAEPEGGRIKGAGRRGGGRRTKIWRRGRFLPAEGGLQP